MSRLIALTHTPSPNMQACERTFIPHLPIDSVVARRQFQSYRAALRDCGCEVRTLNVSQEYPDCAFIEDTAVVLDEIAVLGSMGTKSRSKEPAKIEPVLREYREIERIEGPATLEGGDVLRVGRSLLVGQSCRTNAAGITALSQVTKPYDYQVRAVPVRDCLHLKTACTALPDGRLLVNPQWIDTQTLAGFSLVELPSDEPWGGNVLVIDSLVLLSSEHIRTAELLSGLGYDIRPIDLSEFAKAEAGATCLSLIFTAG